MDPSHWRNSHPGGPIPLAGDSGDEIAGIASDALCRLSEQAFRGWPRGVDIFLAGEAVVGQRRGTDGGGRVRGRGLPCESWRLVARALDRILFRTVPRMNMASAIEAFADRESIGSLGMPTLVNGGFQPCVL